jgi:hypothetical protein
MPSSRLCPSPSVTVQPLAWVITAAAQLLLQGIARLRGQVMRDVELAQGGECRDCERWSSTRPFGIYDHR